MQITDPTAKKPDDWDDDAPPQIPDANAVMPDGWLEDEPEMIPGNTKRAYPVAQFFLLL